MEDCHWPMSSRSKSSDVLLIREIIQSDLQRAGSKAYNLAQLTALGLPVPPGFCVLASHYWNHVEEIRDFDDLLRALQDPDTAADAILAQIRQAILEKPLSADLAELLARFWNRLGGKPVAVRSSATAEDLADHSFAGQYETTLGVQSLEECSKAVKTCWASLWSARAHAYRQAVALPDKRLGMAVIMQQMVPAEISGVLFTVDPVTQHASHVMIEAGLGLGDRLVSGRLTPDRFVIDKRTRKILSRTLAEPPRACLSTELARELTELALVIEEHHQCPQDIEWAVSPSGTFILQSRPITALSEERSSADGQVWTCVNVREVMPEVLTPCTRSLVLDVLHRLTDLVLDIIGLDRGDATVVGLVAGRCYANLNTLVGIAHRIPFVRGARLSLLFGDTVPGEEAQQWLELARRNCPEVKSSPSKALLGLPANLLRGVTYTKRSADRAIEELRNWADEFSRCEQGPLSTPEIVDRLLRSVQDLEDFIFRERFGAIYTFTQVVSFNLLRKVCCRWLKETEAFANGLLVGTGGLADAQAGLDLWQLGRRAADTPDVRSLILSETCWTRIVPGIREVEGGREFLKAWRAFMQTHGHHARGEFELANIRWSEDPDYVLSVIRSFLSDTTQVDVAAAMQVRIEARRRCVRECRTRLRNPLKRTVFYALLERSRHFEATRENGKNHFVRLIALWRSMLVTIGTRLSEQDVLSQPDDIFFLELGELRAVVDGSPDDRPMERIALRRAEYERNRRVTPPITLQGRFRPEKQAPDPGDTDRDRNLFRGLAVSPGRACGQAKVIQGVDDKAQVVPGEILVAPYTDPGWTPYLVAAAGIVVDQGGLLSHGSIIAREYGIPAVVNVGAASRIIKTGNRVEVDGDRGIVRIASL
jgi:phosphohistidine swiveling domain-containing protein